MLKNYYAIIMYSHLETIFEVGYKTLKKIKSVIDP